MVRACVLGTDVIDTKKHGLKQGAHWHSRQNTDFIVVIQPAAFFSLLAALTRVISGIEILILRAFLDIQVSQQHHAWISELLYDSSSHRPLLVPVCGGNAATHC